MRTYRPRDRLKRVRRGWRVGDGWTVNADGSFAFKKGRHSTLQVSGTPSYVRPSRKARKIAWGKAREEAMRLLALLPLPEPPARPRVRLIRRVVE